jgi:ketosteroid isomerase-like protein
MGDREKLLRKFNEAFAKCDTDFLAESVTDDIEWKIIGEKVISGKKEFEKSLARMKVGGPLEIIVNDIILAEERSVVEGIVQFKVEPGKVMKYAFCDVYIFSDSDENKFRELRTYVTNIKKK